MIQIESFKRVELAKIKVEERSQFHSQLSTQKLEFEQQLLLARSKTVETIQEDRARLHEREKEMDRQNLLLKQQMLDEHNNVVIKERQLRNEVELSARHVSLERDQLQRRVTEVQDQLEKLGDFKERYTQRMEESMAQYKIDLNKEYSSLLSSVEIEKTKIHGDKMILQEKESTVERMLSGLKRTEADADRYKQELGESHSRIDDLTRGRDSLLGQINELQLQTLTQKGSTSLEFEISSLKKQLHSAEVATDQRQQDYEVLIKSLAGPKEGIHEELTNARQNELKWKQKCQDLVAKLDNEFSTTDELSRRWERERLRNKELERELADSRLLLHQAQSAMKIAQSTQPLETYVPREISPMRSTVPDPLYDRYAQITSALGPGHVNAGC